VDDALAAASEHVALGPHPPRSVHAGLGNEHRLGLSRFGYLHRAFAFAPKPIG